MSGWQGSTRRQRLPRDWPKRRAAVRRRAGGLCEGRGCGAEGNECDHIVPGDDHSLDNLQWLCEECHKKKTKAEALQARGGSRATRRRPVERHPGLLG